MKAKTKSATAVRSVPAHLMIRANAAASEGPRGFENAMLSIIQALAKEADTEDLLAISYRLQALAKLTRGTDIAGLTMKLHGKEYYLINEAALKAAAACPLSLRGRLADVEFDEKEFVRLALEYTDCDGSA
jgi:hypothetical protein